MPGLPVHSKLVNQAEWIPRTMKYYQSPNSIPNANNLDLNLPQTHLLSIILVPRGLPERYTARIVTVSSPHLCEVGHLHGVKDANFTHEAGDGAHGESASGEAEEEQLIARLVVVGDEVVDLAHVGVETPSNAACGSELEKQFLVT